MEGLPHNHTRGFWKATWPVLCQCPLIVVGKVYLEGSSGEGPRKQLAAFQVRS